MEANLIIKSFKTDGNKITDLQFAGDVEVDIGGVQEIDMPCLSHNVAPTGFNYIENGSTATKMYFKNQTGEKLYYSIIDNGSSSPNQSTKVGMANNYTASFVPTIEMAIGLYSDSALKHLVGYIRFKPGDKPVEIEHY